MSDSKLLPPIPLNGGALLIDNSGWMEGMQACHKIIEFRQLHSRIRAGDAPALSFGTAIHTCKEYRYSKYGVGPVDAQYHQDIAFLMEQHFRDHPVPEGELRNLNWAMETDKQYTRKYDTEDFKLLKHDEPINCPYCNGLGRRFEQYLDGEIDAGSCMWCSGTGKRELMVELSFSLPLFTYTFEPDDYSVMLARYGDAIPKSIPIVYTGKIDLPVFTDGALYILDHKSTGYLGQIFWDRMKRSAQQKGYCWAFEKLTGRKIMGFIINAIRTKEPPQYVLANEVSSRGKKQSPEQWWDESLARERFYLKDNDLVEWEHNTIDLVEEFFWHYIRGYFPERTDACTRFGLCPFYQVCSMDTPDRHGYLYSAEYTENEWTPLKMAHINL